MRVESTDTSEEVVKPPSTGHKTELKNHKQKKLLPPASSPDMSRLWKIEDSEELYRIEGWGQPYFSINAAGHITVSPRAIAVVLWICMNSSTP
jgi:arginine decarboxylase